MRNIMSIVRTFNVIEIEHIVRYSNKSTIITEAQLVTTQKYRLC